MPAARALDIHAEQLIVFERPKVGYRKINNHGMHLAFRPDVRPFSQKGSLIVMSLARGVVQRTSHAKSARGRLCVRIGTRLRARKLRAISRPTSPLSVNSPPRTKPQLEFARALLS